MNFYLSNSHISSFRFKYFTKFEQKQFLSDYSYFLNIFLKINYFDDCLNKAIV